MIGVRVCGCGEKLTRREVGDSRVVTNTLPGGSGYSVRGDALLLACGDTKAIAYL